MQRASTDCQINPFDPINKIKKRIVIFDDDHIHFHEKANNTFLTSHKKTYGYLEEDEDESNNQPREPSLEDDDYSAFTEDSSEDIVNENIPPEEEEVVDEENEYDIRIANAQEILNQLDGMQNETEEQNDTDSVS
jgi:hypothetical protein